MNWYRATGGIAVTIPAIALLAYGLRRDPALIPSPLPGRLAPVFTLAPLAPERRSPDTAATTASADSVSLAAFRGDVVVLNFYASWCTECRGEHGALTHVAARYAGSDVHFLGILYNDTPSNAMRWLAETGTLPYPSLLDPGSRTAIDYGLYGVPETFFIGRDGRVAYKQTGAVTEALLIRTIEALRVAPR